MAIDKTRKIIYIISGSLSIVLMVFFILHKVGLCASVNPPSISSSTLPLPVGEGCGYPSEDFTFTSEMAESIISYLETNNSYLFHNGYAIQMITMSEYNTGSNRLELYAYGFRRDRVSIGVHTVSGTPYSFTITGLSGNEYYQWRVYYYLSDGSIQTSYQGYRPQTFNLYGNNYSYYEDPPSGNGFYFRFNTYLSGYPLYANMELTDDSGNYVLFGSLSSSDPEHSIGGGEVTSLPSFDTLTGNPDSSDTQDTLFDKLKGWLSTINGNIYKGFKNLEDNLTSFFKPYLDNTKEFFQWVFEAPREDEIHAALEATDEYQIYQSVSGLHSSAVALINVAPAQRVAFTLSFAGTMFSFLPDMEVNFDWIASSLPRLKGLLIFFLALTFLFLFIKSIPSILGGQGNVAGIIERSKK